MAEDFAQAERIVSRTFRDGGLVFKPEDLRIDDGIGFKFVGTPEEMAPSSGRSAPTPRWWGSSGKSTGAPTTMSTCWWTWSCPGRGDHAGGAPGLVGPGRPRAERPKSGKGFPAYVEAGESTFRAEVILTTRADLVESEFGSAIHEARIIEQRQGTPYSGRIASNASFIITHMLMLALSPTIETPELPVKMWGRSCPTCN